VESRQTEKLPNAGIWTGALVTNFKGGTKDRLKKSTSTSWSN